MPMDMHEYFRLRCLDTHEALRNMQGLFENLVNDANNMQLKDLLRQQYDCIRADLDGMGRIAERMGQMQPAPQGMEVESGERMVIVGRTWTGTIGRSTVEHYRVYVTQIPQYLIETNAAMISEEVAHFNLGNFTGLIVLAKELGEQDIANMLQESINRGMRIKDTIESSLWQVINSLHQEEQQKAA